MTLLHVWSNVCLCVLCLISNHSGELDVSTYIKSMYVSTPSIDYRSYRITDESRVFQNKFIYLYIVNENEKKSINDTRNNTPHNYSSNTNHNQRTQPEFISFSCHGMEVMDLRSMNTHTPFECDRTHNILLHITATTSCGRRSFLFVSLHCE